MERIVLESLLHLSDASKFQPLSACSPRVCPADRDFPNTSRTREPLLPIKTVESTSHAEGPSKRKRILFDRREIKATRKRPMSSALLLCRLGLKAVSHNANELLVPEKQNCCKLDHGETPLNRSTIDTIDVSATNTHPDFSCPLRSSSLASLFTGHAINHMEPSLYPVLRSSGTHLAHCTDQNTIQKHDGVRARAVAQKDTQGFYVRRSSLHATQPR